MIMVFFAKQSYYGGREFVIYNDITRKFATGNTASTAISYNRADIEVKEMRQKDLKALTQALERYGFEEYKVNWSKDFNTYGDIEKNLLAREVAK